MKKFLLLAAVVLGVWLCVRPAPAARWSGRPGTVPVQSTTGLPASWVHDGFIYVPLARFSIRAVVLSRERYRYDPGAKFAPVDLALGWDAMSDAQVINSMDISQSGRWYEYSGREEPPIPLAEIARSSANMHMVPANQAMRAELLKVKRHELVELSGYLVEIRGEDGWHWRSSTSRDDTGGGACELIWVEAVQRWSLGPS